LALGLMTALMFLKFDEPPAELEPDVIPPNVVANTEIPETNLDKHPDATIESSSESNIESFTDYKRIGRARRNKIEIRCFDQENKRVAEIKFYSRVHTRAWKQKQSLEFTKDDHLDCDPRIEDFNNDGLMDLTYQSGIAARGANEIRKLFIYDKKRDELTYIKNSEYYPNMVYNKRRDCIDAWLFYGATSTVFLKLDGDKLKEFAMVSTGLELISEAIDNNGKSRVLSRK